MTKPTIASLEAALAEAKQEAQDIFHELTEAKGKLSRAVDKTGDNEPWLLAAAGFVIGGIAASLLWMVL